MILNDFIVKRSLIVARVDIAAEVCQIIKLKRTIIDPIIKKALIMAYTRFIWLNCVWHNQMRLFNFAKRANDIDRTVADSILDDRGEELFKWMISQRI